MIDRDPWDLPAEVHEPDLTPEEWLDIRHELFEEFHPWNDHSFHPECLLEAVKVLGEIGTSNTPDPARAATQCLRRMVYRARNGGWPGEQEAEPAWSLDSERGGPR